MTVSRCGLFDEPVNLPADHYPQVVWLARKYAEDAEAREAQPQEGPLVVRASDLTTSVHSGAIGAAASGKLTSKCVHGLEHNMTPWAAEEIMQAEERFRGRMRKSGR
jgi:hypothetical protein